MQKPNVLKNTLFKNIISLSFLQAVNFLLTLLVLPYVANAMGASSWGKVVFVQMVINYVSWTVNWGYYLGATKKVSEFRKSKSMRSEIFYSVWFSQWILTVVASLLFLFFVAKINFFNCNSELYIAASGLIIGNTLTPLWYLNGLEMVKESALIQIFTKIIALPAIFLFVDNSESAKIYLAINSGASIIVGFCFSIWLMRSRYLIFICPTILQIYQVTKTDLGLYISSMLANLNASIVPGMLGIYGGDAQLGFYNLADRAKGAAITVLHPIAHALFPRMCYLYTNDRYEAIKILKKSGAILIGFSCITGVLIFNFAPQVIGLLGGGDFYQAIEPLKYFALMPAICTASAFIIYQIVIPSGHYSTYTRMIILCMIVAAGMVLMQGHGLDANKAALISMAVELIGLGYLLFTCKKLRLVSLDN